MILAADAVFIFNTLIAGKASAIRIIAVGEAVQIAFGRVVIQLIEPFLADNGFLGACWREGPS